MQRAVSPQNLSVHFDEIGCSSELKQVLDKLQDENSQLKALVVRLSETIIRTVTAKR